MQQLQWRQRRLTAEVEALGLEIRKLEDRLISSPFAFQDIAASPQSITPPPEVPTGSLPPPIPPVIPQPVVEPGRDSIYKVRISQKPEEQPASGAPVFEQAPSPAFQPATPPFHAPAAEDKGSFEMQLGTYWFVRVGIVLLLTALAFLGNYAYQNFIMGLGAPGKVTLMYIVSAALLGAGTWLQRKESKESMRNYAQVLFAGGLAAVYFTTYAAHHIERLRVIHSPVLDGMLLLAWAAFIVWIAHRKKSELLAMFALGLAYYTSVITRTGSFTLYSNLVLTAASVYFLWRNRWAMLSFISLPATYAGYAFWRFYTNEGWSYPTPDQGLLFSAAFLGAYWLVFTAAVFLTRNEGFRSVDRAGFLSFNNGAAFSLFLLTMVQVQSGGLWKVCLIFGGALLVLALLARRFLPEDPLAENSYLTQGLVLVTAGFIAKFSGMNLALLLAIESVILLTLGTRLQRQVLVVGGYVASLLAVAWVLDVFNASDRSTIFLGLGVAIAMLTNSVYMARHTEPADVLRPQVSYFSVLLLITLASLTWSHAERADLPVLLLAQAVLLTLSYYLLRTPEISCLSQLFVLGAILGWAANAVARSVPWEPSWQPALLVVGLAGLLHWWERQRTLQVSNSTAMLFQGLAATGIVAVLYTWIRPHIVVSGYEYQAGAAMAGLALALTLYSMLTRSRLLAAVTQLLLLSATYSFIVHVLEGRAPWQWLVVVPVIIQLLAANGNFFLRCNPRISEDSRLVIATAARVYAWTAVVMVIALVANYVNATDRPWVYALLAVAAFAWAGMRTGEMLQQSIVLTVCSVLAYVLPMKDEVYTHVPNLLAIALILVQQRAARRLPDRYGFTEPMHTALIGLGGVMLWLFLSRFVMQQASGFLLTASWSGLALLLFALGMALHERTYRWLGLLVLGCSLGRIVLFDIWKLHTLYRILSLAALSVVLLLLGYIYNRYQEKIRQWL